MKFLLILSSLIYYAAAQIQQQQPQQFQLVQIPMAQIQSALQQQQQQQFQQGQQLQQQKPGGGGRKLRLRGYGMKQTLELLCALWLGAFIGFVLVCIWWYCWTQRQFKFGTWPIMEVTRLVKKPNNNNHNNHNPNNNGQNNGPPKKRPRGLGALAGFMQNAIASNALNKKIPPGSQKHPQQERPPKKGRRRPFGRQPPPPPPSTTTTTQSPPPVILGPVGALPPGAIPIAFPNNQQQPFIIRGPPPLPTVPSTTTTTSTLPPIDFSSVMGPVMSNVAYSGYFNQGPHPQPSSSSIFSFPRRLMRPFASHQSQSHYRGNTIVGNPQASPSFNIPYRVPPPPPFQPQQQNHHPNLFMGPPALPLQPQPFLVNKVPSPPPIITIGAHPPSGYTMTHGEQQLITLKLPDGKRMSDTEALLKGAEYKYGYHSDLSHLHPIPLRRVEQQGVVKDDKRLPDVGALYTVNIVLQTPNISAPTNGSESPSFRSGMEMMDKVYGVETQGALKKDAPVSPLDGQVRLLGKLFTELQRLKTPPSLNSNNEIDGRSSSSSSSITDPFGDSTTVVTKYSKPKVDAPLMAVHIQSFSMPEVGSSDPDILESARVFGLQGHKFEFGNTNEVINLMDTAQKAVGGKIPLEELGKSRGEVSANLQEWIKSYVSLARRMKDQAHSKGEGIANGAFRQYQYHLRAPGSNTMTPMDPKLFSQAASITNAGAVATFQG